MPLKSKQNSLPHLEVFLKLKHKQFNSNSSSTRLQNKSQKFFLFKWLAKVKGMQNCTAVSDQLGLTTCGVHSVWNAARACMMQTMVLVSQHLNCNLFFTRHTKVRKCQLWHAPTPFNDASSISGTHEEQVS